MWCDNKSDLASVFEDLMRLRTCREMELWTGVCLRSPCAQAASSPHPRLPLETWAALPDSSLQRVLLCFLRAPTIAKVMSLIWCSSRTPVIELDLDVHNLYILDNRLLRRGKTFSWIQYIPSKRSRWKMPNSGLLAAELLRTESA